jgi:dCMP deaminase
MIDTRATWAEWGLGLADAVATRADCSRRQVGAVIVTPHNRVVSTGYNGAPSGHRGCLTEGACPRGQSSVETLITSYDTGPGMCIALHAEQNALLRASWADMQGGTLYVTCEPCPGCARMIIGTPLSFVVWRRGEFITRQEL